MKVILRVDKSGVSEVIGTILILAMTVVLFSVIILWVTSIPTPVAQTRLDIRSTMIPIYDALGQEIGVNITLFHQGGEALQPAPTLLYVTSQRAGNPPQTDVVTLHLYSGLLATPNGLLDGTDSVWDIGERWAYKNFILKSSDTITLTIIDLLRSAVVWTGQMNAPAGTRPPVFVDKWADDIRGTDAIDPVQENLGFYLYVEVVDPDNDLNPNSVWATLTMWYGTSDPCALPQRMRDDGLPPDRVAGDNIFTLGRIACMSPPFPLLSWDGSIILLNATDMKGHQTTTRMILKVVEQFSGGGTQTIPSELWQYIGFVQVRAEEVWFTHLNDPVGTSTRFSLGRVQRADLNGGAGALFQLFMANHGNRTVFVDGYTSLSFRSGSSSNVQSIYIVCGVKKDPAGNVKCPTVDPARPANAGGLAKYPGIPTVFSDFQYAQVFDINPLDQETGGTPVVILATSRTRFDCCQTILWGADSYYPSILVSGISGPLNMTYQQVIDRWGTNYNPYDHLNDLDTATRTQWYAQVIPFIAMTVI